MDNLEKELAIMEACVDGLDQENGLMGHTIEGIQFQ